MDDAELREGDNELIRVLAKDAGIKLTAPDHMLGLQWEQFHEGVMKLAKGITKDNPPWIECNLPWSDFDITSADTKDFEQSELCRPGVEIEIKHHEDGKIERLLIGHINPQSGATHGVSEIYGVDVVLRYRVLVPAEALEKTESKT